jgi:hypothetical protein
MSYTLTTKSFESTSTRTISTSIAQWLVENIPELTLSGTNTSTSYYTYNYLKWDNLSVGIGVYGYYRSSTYTPSIYLGLYHNISGSTATSLSTS